MLQGSKMGLIYFFNYSVLLLLVIAEDWNLFVTYCMVLIFIKSYQLCYSQCGCASTVSWLIAYMGKK